MSIKRSLAISGIWTVTAAAFTNLSSFAVFLVLARLLEPAEFGIVAFATIFVDLGRVVVSAGIPEALIRHDEWDEELASSAFWTNMAIAAVMCALLSGLAAPMAGEYHGTGFGLVLAALSLTLLIDGTTTVHVAKLRRDFEYKAIAVRGMSTSVLSAIIGVTLALTGWGVWALVISRIVASLGTSIILWRATDFRPGLRFNFQKIRGIAGFSVSQLGSGLLGRANAMLAPLILGFVAGPAAVAQYRIGSRALDLMITLVINPLRTTALSAFSSVRGRAGGVHDGYLRVTRTCALIACPFFFGAAAVGVDFTITVFGPQWEQGGYIMAALALVVGPAAITYFHAAALAAEGKAGKAFVINVAQVIGTALVAALLAPFGAILVAVGQTARTHITLPFSLRIVQKATGISPYKSIRSIAPAYLSAALMAGLITAAHLTFLADTDRGVRLLISVAAGPILYFLALRLLFPGPLRESMHELLPLVPARLRKLVPLG